MPIHDWSHVEAGIFHDFHHAWIEEIQRSLNAGLLRDDFYAMAEQQSGPFGTDALTLQAGESSGHSVGMEIADADVDEFAYSSVLLAPPTVALTAEAALEFYRRKQNMIAIRHVSGDEIPH